MKKLILILLFSFIALPCLAQWHATGFVGRGQILAFGVHDTSFFWSISPANLNEALIFRYPTRSTWISADEGIDSTQGNITSFASLGKYFFAGQTQLDGTKARSYRSSDNGGTWQPIGGSPVYTNGFYLFASSVSSVYRSGNNGDSWQGVPCPAASSFSGVGVVIIASTSKGLYRSTDTGGTWSLVTTPISGISVFALVGSAVYAANGTQLIRSLDNGSTWSLVNTSFSVSSLATDSTHLFAGGPSGVYLLDSDGSTWTNESNDSTLTGHAAVAVGIFDTLIYADFSFNNPDYPYRLYTRSIIEMTSKSLVVSEPPSSDTIAVFPNPASRMVTVYSGSTFIERVQVLNVLGEAVPISEDQGPSSKFSLDFSKVPDGTYFIELQTASNTVLRKIILER